MRDFLGNELAVGDRVVFSPIGRGHGGPLGVAKVTAFGITGYHNVDIVTLRSEATGRVVERPPFQLAKVPA